MKDGDIFRWSWNDKQLDKLEYKNSSGTLYWCSSRIVVYKDGLLRDTYWASSSDGKTFTPEQAEDILELRFIANESDLYPANPTDRAYYEDEDCVDLSHPNSSRGNFYLRKGAKKSLTKMKKVLTRYIKREEASVRYAQQEVERAQDNLKTLTLDSYIPLCDHISLEDNSWEDGE